MVGDLNMLKKYILYIIIIPFIYNIYAIVIEFKSVSNEFIYDISKLSAGNIHATYTPTSTAELRDIVKNSKYPVSIAGGRFSQGGHIWNDGGITIDMSKLNSILHFDVHRKMITVETGATWQQVQKYIDKYGLSIKVMQSYNDFSVGGSLSVNVHGRTICDGALIETVESIKLLLADGSFVKANRIENYDLFRAAIGGYGAVGVIIEVTLLLTNNDKIEKKEVILPLDQYLTFFNALIKNNSTVIFHNANVDIKDFNRVISITWYKTNKPCTIADRMQENKLFKDKSFTFEYFGFQVARYIRPLCKIRLPVDTLKNNQQVVWRNYEMSASVKGIEPMSRVVTTTILQEYFIPCGKLCRFIEQLKEIVQKNNVNMMNISIRYIHQDTESIMAYAQKAESFSVVCYINMVNNKESMEEAEMWTQKLINAALNNKGTYYLPYQLYASQLQFRYAYPKYKELLAIKKKVDSYNRFTNSFLSKYLIG